LTRRTSNSRVVGVNIEVADVEFKGGGSQH
jgi:hypothetical protein